jgi:hypothetical protein
VVPRYLVVVLQVAVVVQQVVVMVWCHRLLVVSLQVAALDLAVTLLGVGMV